jgi:hypothetical protein
MAASNDSNDVGERNAIQAGDRLRRSFHLYPVAVHSRRCLLRDAAPVSEVKGCEISGNREGRSVPGVELRAGIGFPEQEDQR